MVYKIMDGIDFYDARKIMRDIFVENFNGIMAMLMGGDRIAFYLEKADDPYSGRIKVCARNEPNEGLCAKDTFYSLAPIGRNVMRVILNDKLAREEIKEYYANRLENIIYMPISWSKIIYDYLGIE